MTFTGLVIDPTGQSKVIREVLVVIEDVRLKRHSQWREQPHPQGKRFTQDEIRYDPARLITICFLGAANASPLDKPCSTLRSI